MKNENIVQVDHVSKAFKLPHEKQTSIKSVLINIGKSEKGYERQQVLKDVSFNIKKGEFFAIVGRNGSGKSTLLKLLAGIYRQDEGDIQVRGKLTPFIELGVGFNPELTGRENVYLNGALLGFNRKEMDALYDDIVEFAEIERFMDQKLKNYSSGMQVRLAFSIAIRAKSDILLIDEVLAVGDANFQQKCYEYFYRLKKERQTVVLVTHDMSAVKNFCDRAVLIHDGVLRAEGSPFEIAREYTKLNLPSDEQGNAGNHLGNGKLRFSDCRVVYPRGLKSFEPEHKIVIDISLDVREEVRNPIIGVTVKDLIGREILVTNTKELAIETGVFKKGTKRTCRFTIGNILNDGTYTVSPGSMDMDMKELYDSQDEASRFEVRGWAFPTGIAHAPTECELDTEESSRG